MPPRCRSAVKPNSEGCLPYLVVADDPDELKVNVSGYGRLGSPAKAKLHEIVSNRPARALGEASRLESDWRSDTSATPEITAKDIEDAFRFIERAPAPKKTRFQRICDTVAFMTVFVGGVFTNNIDTPGGAIGFALCAVIAVVA